MMAIEEISVDVSEFEGFAQLLDRFPLEVQNKFLKNATGAGASVMQVAVINAAPTKVEQSGPKSNSLPSGYVKADIRVEALKGVQRGWLIGPSKATAHVVRWLEFGYQLVRGGSLKSGRGHVVNHVAAKPFLRPAFDAHWRDANRAIAEQLGKQIDEYWKQTLKRVGRG